MLPGAATTSATDPETYGEPTTKQWVIHRNTLQRIHTAKAKRAKVIRVGAGVSHRESAAKTVVFKANCLSLQEDEDPDKSRRHETGWSCKAKQADAQEGRETQD